MTNLKLKNGTLIVPDDFVVVEKTVTPDANYAGVIAERNGSLPRFVVLSEKPISDIRCEEQEHLYTLCAEICPKVADVLEKEVEPKFDEFGLVENKDEWRNAPCLGLFPIEEVVDEQHLFNGTGILRKEQ